MSTDSSVAGYLQPAVSPAPLESQALQRFLQQWLVGVTGLDGTLVRSRWQAEPPTIPNAGTVWAAFGITNRTADWQPVFIHNPLGDGSDVMQRNEELTLLTTFYDLGVNGQADTFATLLRDNAMLPQNLEPLFLANMGIIETGDLVSVPVLVKQRWQYRVDLEIRIRRLITRVFPILNLKSAAGALVTDSGQTRNIGVPHP